MTKPVYESFHVDYGKSVLVAKKAKSLSTRK